MKIVLDTNILVSALLKRNSLPGRILDLVLGRQVILAVDHRIFAEYRDVLYRPELELPKKDAADLLDFLWHSSERVQAVKLPIQLPDTDDIMFVEVAVGSFADALVTGNVKHFPTPQRHGVHLLTPRQFLDVWAARNRNNR